MRYVYGALARAGKVKNKTPKVKKSKAKKKQLTGRAKRRRQYNIKNNFKPTKENWESEVKNSKSIRSILVGTVSIPMPKSVWRDKKIKDFSTHLTSRKLGPKYRERQRERRNFEEEKMSFCYSTQSIEDSISCFRNHGGDIFKTKRGNFEEKPRIFRRLPHLVEGLVIHSKNWKEGSSHQWVKRHLVRRYRYRTVVRGREIVVGANSTLFVRIIEQEEEK